MRTYEVTKRHKRLHIIIVESEAIVYTPPDFVTLPNREPLKDLAARFTVLQREDITEIIHFETQWSRPCTRQ